MGVHTRGTQAIKKTAVAILFTGLPPGNTNIIIVIPTIIAGWVVGFKAKMDAINPRSRDENGGL
jgi:hypothetical protein